MGRDTVLSLSPAPTLGPKGTSGSQRDPGAAGCITTEGSCSPDRSPVPAASVSSPSFVSLRWEEGLAELRVTARRAAACAALERGLGLWAPKGTRSPPRASRGPCLLFLTILPAYLSLQQTWPLPRTWARVCSADAHSLSHS